MTVYHTADLHLGHARIIELSQRPFVDVDEMNETLIANWNSVVGPADYVFIHGDLCMGRKNETVPLIRQLNGRKLLLAGNHDPMHETYDKREWKRDEWFNRYLEAGLEAINREGQLLQRAEFDQPVLMTHFPYEGDSQYDERYAEFRPHDDGMTLLHGHVHEAWRVKRSSKGTLMLNVGVDAHDFHPISTETIARLLREAS